MNHIATHTLTTWLAAAVLILATGLPGCEDSPSTPAGKTQSVTLPVQGMHCDGCAQAITAKLGKLPGVVNCSASFENKQAVVELAANATTTQADLIKAIEAMGYTVGESPADPPAGETP